MLEIDVSKRLRDFSLAVRLDVARGETLMLVVTTAAARPLFSTSSPA